MLAQLPPKDLIIKVNGTLSAKRRYEVLRKEILDQ